MDPERFRRSPTGHLAAIRGTDGRTGRAYEHVAFVPAPLTSEPDLDAATWRAVASAHYALGRLQQASRQVPAPHLLRRPTLQREAQSTSALEGTFAPLEDVLAADVSSGPRSAELDEVINYIRTADAAFDWLSDGRHITVSMLAELQRRLVRGTAADTDEAGRIRQIQVAIGSSGARIQDARFIPAPPGPELESSVRDFVDWLNESTSLDPVVAAGMAHYQFETLHPFNDGNGRLGRLLIVLHLQQLGLLTEPLLSVSPWFEARRREYQDQLLAVSRDGAWTSWIRFFALGLAASAEDTAIRVDALLILQQDYLARLRDADATGIVVDIANSLIEAPFVTVSSLVTRHGKTYQALNNAVKKLESIGILRERTGRAHGRVFEAPEVVAILIAPSP